MLRGAANTHSCRFDLLCASGSDGEFAVRAIWESIKNHPSRAGLERFYELERDGCKGKRNTAIACCPAIRRFYDTIAKAGAQAGFFSLYLLEFGDSVVAGHFGLAYNGRYYSPKVAYDEKFAAY